MAHHFQKEVRHLPESYSKPSSRLASFWRHFWGSQCLTDVSFSRWYDVNCWRCNGANCWRLIVVSIGQKWYGFWNRLLCNSYKCCVYFKFHVQNIMTLSHQKMTMYTCMSFPGQNCYMSFKIDYDQNMTSHGCQTIWIMLLFPIF